ncbi:MAG: metal ABC transporter permease, partial [Leptospiraceae bacterium]|nr:metal ABC transporter permease [Leptospiraceae bacterium]
MESHLQSLKFFLPQLTLGIILGAVISFLGVIIVLRKMAFFGVTLSQIVSSSVAISLFLDLRSDFLIIFLSSVFLVPLLLFSRKEAYLDSKLGIIFVSFTAFSQLLLSLGGNVKNHLMSAYFGDILTSQVKIFSTTFTIVILCFIWFVIFYEKILFFSFDENEFRIRKLSVNFTEISFYLILTIAISVSVNLLGSFYSIAHLLIPVFTALSFARSMRFLFVFSGIFSIFATFSGFFLSLFPF